MSEEIQILNNPEANPTDAHLKNILPASYFQLYTNLFTLLTSEMEILPEWRFYNDGKAWLCKCVYKKKTVLWISLWEKYIKAGFYFTENTSSGVYELPISPLLKDALRNATPIGKLRPLTLVLKTQKNLEDLRRIIEYKKSLK